MLSQKSLSIIGVMFMFAILSISYANINQQYPWHPLQQISISDTNLRSIDENKDGRIDLGLTEENLDSITSNGGETLNSISVGAITSTGLTVNGPAVISNILTLGKWYIYYVSPPGVSYATGDQIVIGKSSQGTDEDVIWIGPNSATGGVGHIELDARYVYIDNAKLGIDTFNPQYKLDIYNTGDYVIHAGTNDGNDLTIDIAGGQGLVNIVAGAKASGNDYVFTGTRGASRIMLHDGSISLLTSTTTTGTSGSKVSWNYVFYGNNLGRVGIGTTSPQAKLDVNGNVIVRGTLDLTNHRIVNLADPVNPQDAATKAYVDTQLQNVGGGTLDIVTTTCSITNTYSLSCTTYCPSGYKLTGGGCWGSYVIYAYVRESFPYNNGWKCTIGSNMISSVQVSGTLGMGYAICARIV